MGEGRGAREGEGQLGHNQDPMGLGDKFCARDITNIYNIYEGQTLRMSSWSRIVFASTSASVEARSVFASNMPACSNISICAHGCQPRTESEVGGGTRYTWTRTR